MLLTLRYTETTSLVHPANDIVVSPPTATLVASTAEVSVLATADPLLVNPDATVGTVVDDVVPANATISIPGVIPESVTSAPAPFAHDPTN